MMMMMMILTDKHKFCVILGVGACKYRTDVIEDLFDNPVFNTECDMSVLSQCVLVCTNRAARQCEAGASVTLRYQVSVFSLTFVSFL